MINQGIITNICELIRAQVKTHRRVLITIETCLARRSIDHLTLGDNEQLLCIVDIYIYIYIFIYLFIYRAKGKLSSYIPIKHKAQSHVRVMYVYFASRD